MLPESNGEKPGEKLGNPPNAEKKEPPGLFLLPLWPLRLPKKSSNGSSAPK